MKFNPLEWSQVNGEEIQAPSGVLQLRSVAPFGVTVECQGCEAAYGVAPTHRIALPYAAKVTLTATAPVYRKDTPSRVVRMTGEKFTNIDRLPQESGTMLEVTRAVRMMKLEERAMIRRIREERAAAEALIEKAKPKPEPKAEPKPEPKPDAKADGEAKDAAK